jgi:hypothetical protein
VVGASDLVCRTPTCVPVIGGVLVYRQGSHVTNTYVETTAEVMRSRIIPLIEEPRK